MEEYELLIEAINPCGGSAHATRTILEIETDDPERYVRENAVFPIIDTGKNSDGDLVITTGDGKGYITKYTFSL